MADADVDVPRPGEVTKLPLWYGNPSKDTFLPLQWVERVEKAKIAGTWTDAQTMAFVYLALRQNALIWWDSLNRSGVSTLIWDEFKAAFIQGYAATRTARTAVVNLDIKQQPTETVLDYYARIVKSVDDLEALLPAARRVPGVNLFHADIVALQGWAGAPEASKNATAAAYMKTGVTSAFNHLALQLFIANLRPNLREELMKNIPETLYDAFTMAQDMEKILTEPKKQNTFLSVQEVKVVESEEELMLELAAVQTRVQNFRGRSQARGRGNKPGRGGHGGGGGQAQGQTGDYNKCRYCSLFGHIQKFCHKRIAAGAPMVDKIGKPYPAKISEINTQGREQLNHSTPPQQTQQQQGNHSMAPGAMQNQGAPNYFQHPTPGYLSAAQGAPGFFMPPDFQN